MPPRSLAQLGKTVTACRACPRLVDYLAEVAVTKRRAFRDWDYWARPLPGRGDPKARLLVVGLAPAAHGGTRTGRVFTGDSSSQFLARALHQAGFASQPTSVHRDDGLELSDCYITLAARCAPPENKPTPEELARCLPFLVDEIRLLPRVRVVVALGAIAHEAVLNAWAVPRPRPRFGHAAEATLPDGRQLVDTYHPSQQNTQTGRLTEAMFDAVFRRVRTLLDTERR
jgi:uracil-DNA glycosylase family 4